MPHGSAHWRYTRQSMRVHEMSVEECQATLARCDLGRLGCAHDNQPYVVPIHYSFDSERNCLYAFSAVGQKVAWMRENPKVCVEVEDVTDRDRWVTVLVFGRFEELGDSIADQVARRTAEELFSKRREWWFPAAAKVGSSERHAVIIYRIKIHRVTGRRAARPPTAS
jgi:nitroimidazol reductase NimA-like FMN-containing flavoprotein (pyridoxamine 5'-phosphate oxidase superfamily)